MLTIYDFFLIDAKNRSKISSDQKRLFFAVNLYPLSFFANSYFKFRKLTSKRDYISIINIKIYFHQMYMTNYKKQKSLNLDYESNLIIN